jgi:iron complex transport system permease protein
MIHPSGQLRGQTASIDPGYRRLVVRSGSCSVLVRTRSLTVGAVLVVLILVLGILALGLGTYPLSPSSVIRTLLGGGEALDRTVVFEWRLARTLSAILLGGFLAVAGALFQSVTRNPLASPDILGLSNGAFTGMLLTVVFLSASWPLMTAGAVIGGLATAVAIWTLAHQGGVQGFRLIVVGIGVAALLSSANTWMLLEVELETAMFASAWGAGTLNGVTIAPLVGAVACGIPLLASLVLLTAAVGLVSVSTAVIGPVAFIALAAPQVARRIAATPYLSLGLSAMVGSLMLLGSDLIAQHVLPVSLPVGVVTVSVGGIYLVVTLIQEIRRRA